MSSKSAGMGTPFYRTCLEERMYGYLVGFGLKPHSLNGFVEQYPTISGFVLDFYLPKKKLVLETDGAQFHNSSKQKRRDRFRDRILRHGGYTVVRFPEYFEKPDVEKVLIAHEIPIKTLNQ